MFQRIGISALMLFSALAAVGPQLAQAADRNGFRRESFRREVVEHRVRHERFDGYYDRARCWHAYR